MLLVKILLKFCSCREDTFKTALFLVEMRGGSEVFVREGNCKISLKKNNSTVFILYFIGKYYLK